MELISADTILDYFKTAVGENKALNPQLWADAAMKLNICLIDEEEKLHLARRTVAEMKLKYLDAMEKRSVADAEARVEATQEYQDMRRQESKCARIEEFIRLAKLNQRTAQGI